MLAVSSPQPSVLHLVTLFRQITAGEIRIPAFQREFVWQDKQMIELLESVANGFPIGSILLWGVDSKTLRIAPSDMTSFPTVEEKYPAAYVLDGMQRLSTLYGVFHFGISTKDSRFDVLYDLAARQFFHRSTDEFDPASSLPLAALFTPRQLLEHQARLGAMPDGDTLIERLLELQAAFQEYMIPVVTIKSNDVRQIVAIFEKINSTGMRLDPVDFMRAITWAEEFDLNQHIDMAESDLLEFGIEIDPETLIKCVGLILDIPPTTNGLLQLRDRSPEELTTAFQDTVGSMKKVADFLKINLNIFSSDSVPYEGQLLLLFKAIGIDDAKGEEIERIVHWFWATGFNESLRGKPDHYVVRALDNWHGLVRGDIRGLEPRLKLAEIELLERRLVAGRALSTTFTTMYAANHAESLFTGEVIEPVNYMGRSDTYWFDPILPRHILLLGGMSQVISARIFGNVVLMDQLELLAHGGSVKDIVMRAATENRWGALNSQFIDENCVGLLAQGNVRAFLEARVGLMHRKAKELVDNA